MHGLSIVATRGDGCANRWLNQIPMTISSRTPEGKFNTCPVCGKSLNIEPSTPPGDAPCPHCGQLLWFAHGQWVFPVASADLLGAAHFSHVTEMVDSCDLPECITDSVAATVANHCEVAGFPVYETMDALVVAVAEPIDYDGIDKLRFYLNRQIVLFPTTTQKLRRLSDKYSSPQAT